MFSICGYNANCYICRIYIKKLKLKKKEDATDAAPYVIKVEVVSYTISKGLVKAGKKYWIIRGNSFSF